MSRRGNEGYGRSGHWVEWRGAEEKGVLLVRAGAGLAVRAAHAARPRWGVEHLRHVLVVGLDVALQLLFVVEFILISNTDFISNLESFSASVRCGKG